METYIPFKEKFSKARIISQKVENNFKQQNVLCSSRYVFSTLTHNATVTVGWPYETNYRPESVYDLKIAVTYSNGFCQLKCVGMSVMVHLIMHVRKDSEVLDKFWYNFQ